tara:strand:- start:2916 stop:4889 length:1974 start_codon:yes stop_codon:yes gene_type:complete
MADKIKEYYQKNYLDNESTNYNNFSINSLDINKIKQIIFNLLQWVEKVTQIDKNNENFHDIRKRFERCLNLEFRKSKIINIRKSTLLNVCDYLTLDNSVETNHFIEFNQNNRELIEKYLDTLKYLLRKRPSRNISGITSITVITTPFPDGQKFSCRHNCYYCPNEPAHEGNKWQAQPRSYLYKEPAVLRANQNNFMALDQMLARMDTLFFNGHVIDKIEIILEGGTYTEYPVDYLERFNRDIFYAANIYYDYRNIVDNYKQLNYQQSREEILQKLDMIRPPLNIQQETQLNQRSRVHIIGISCETRPDAIDKEWLWRFRKWGITRVQIGMQHVDNRILKKINRGHTIEQALWAMNYLKDNCFKIDIHIMPDLPGSNPSLDREMFDYVYNIVCPDEMKIYPCEVVPWTIIEKWYKQGKYVPYFDNNPGDLFNVVKYAMLKCPNYIRLPRVIRDIPGDYVESGNTFSNMRQMIDNDLSSEGLISYDIRAREIGRNLQYYKKPASYNIYYKEANHGDDYFIAYQSLDKKALFGFIRLRLVDFNNSLTCLDILKDCALIRELHVYGDTNRVGMQNKYGSQHTGIGKNLLHIAEKHSMKKGFYKIVVISGEGVKGYYKKFGYIECHTFMIKYFPFWKVWFYMVLNYLIYLKYVILNIICYLY